MAESLDNISLARSVTEPDIPSVAARGGDERDNHGPSVSSSLRLKLMSYNSMRSKRSPALDGEASADNDQDDNPPMQRSMHHFRKGPGNLRRKNPKGISKDIATKFTRYQLDFSAEDTGTVRGSFDSTETVKQSDPMVATKLTAESIRSSSSSTSGEFFSRYDGVEDYKTRSAHSVTRSRNPSIDFSRVDNMLFEDAASSKGSQTTHSASQFVEQYSDLAKKVGMEPFPAGYSQIVDEQETVAPTPSDTLTRRSASHTASQHATESFKGLVSWISRKNRPFSPSKTAGGGSSALSKPDNMKGLHLQEIIRLGGSRNFEALPPNLTPGPLEIPSPIFKVLMHIFENGVNSPGIFRIPGNRTTVAMLYDELTKRIGGHEEDTQDILATQASFDLPDYIQFDINDVASTFKKMLSSLPGGLLGSLTVFKALHDISAYLFVNPVNDPVTKLELKPRMIALALSTLTYHRLSLVCAVFGVLHSIAESTRTNTPVNDVPPYNNQGMSAEALSIVFGPVLLGDLLDQIHIQDSAERGSLLFLPDSMPGDKLSLAELQMAQVKRAGEVTGMLIREWLSILDHFSFLEPFLHITQRKGYQGSRFASRAVAVGEAKMTLRRAKIASDSPPVLRLRPFSAFMGGQGDHLRKSQYLDGPRSPDSASLLKQAESVLNMDSPLSEEHMYPFPEMSRSPEGEEPLHKSPSVYKDDLKQSINTAIRYDTFHHQEIEGGATEGNYLPVTPQANIQARRRAPAPVSRDKSCQTDLIGRDDTSSLLAPKNRSTSMINLNAVGGGSQTAAARYSNTALYSEIRRLLKEAQESAQEYETLKREFDVKSDFNEVLSRKIREKNLQVDIWKHRAAWAETQVKDERARYALYRATNGAVGRATGRATGGATDGANDEANDGIKGRAKRWTEKWTRKGTKDGAKDEAKDGAKSRMMKIFPW